MLRWLRSLRYTGRHRLFWPADHHNPPVGTVYTDPKIRHVNLTTRKHSRVWIEHIGQGRIRLIGPI